MLMMLSSQVYVDTLYKLSCTVCAFLYKIEECGRCMLVLHVAPRVTLDLPHSHKLHLPFDCHVLTKISYPTSNVYF